MSYRENSGKQRSRFDRLLALYIEVMESDMTGTNVPAQRAAMRINAELEKEIFLQ